MEQGRKDDNSRGREASYSKEKRMTEREVKAVHPHS
jgi:hypothetical protein